MKKTLTVNLNNIVFHIDDDAYDILQTYLHDIAGHFTDEAERKEIMNDVEARIAELFNEKLQRIKNVINIDDVQEVIQVMGKPSEYADGSEEEQATQTQEPHKKHHSKSKRFYRDPENSVLGGVAGGLAAYFNIDVTIIRILMVVMVFIGVGFVIPVYLVVWLVAPEATSASQRLEMQGQDVTVESIKTELNNARSYVTSDDFKRSASHAGVRVGRILRTIIRALFGFVATIIGVSGVIAIGALLLVLFVLIFNPSTMGWLAPDLTSLSLSPDKLILIVVSLIFVIGCPIFLLLYWLFHLFTGRYSVSRTTSWVIVILWLAGLFMFYSVGADAVFNSKIKSNWIINESDSINSNKREVESFDGIDVSGNIHVVFVNDSMNGITVKAPKEIAEKVITEVEDGVLHVYTQDATFLFRRIAVYVPVDTLNSIVVSGASKIESRVLLNTSSLHIEVSGASYADLDVSVYGLLDLDLSGASKVKLSGDADEMKLATSGASRLTAAGLKLKRCDIEASGASHCLVNVSESLNAEATGASSIHCKGKPKQIEKSDNAGSDITIE